MMELAAFGDSPGGASGLRCGQRTLPSWAATACHSLLAQGLEAVASGHLPDGLKFAGGRLHLAEEEELPALMVSLEALFLASRQ